MACDLCDQVVRSHGYLAQHRNKKKCLDRQRIRKQYQDQLEASVSRMESLRVSESDTSDTGNSSKVFRNDNSDKFHSKDSFYVDMGSLSMWVLFWKSWGSWQPYMRLKHKIFNHSKNQFNSI